MRILFTDEVLEATITAGDENPNYPASNIGHRFVRLRYQANGTSDTITITLAAAKSINCIFYGFHNLSSLEFRLYDAGDTLLKTVTVSSPETYGSEYFTAVDSVAYLELDVVSADVAYLGKVSCGGYYQAKDPGADWDEPVTDNSVVTESPSGQTLSTLVEPLEGFSCTVHDLSRAQWLELWELYKAVGVGATMWLDAFENDHDFKLPLYCKMDQPPDRSKSDKNFDVALSWREAR